MKYPVAIVQNIDERKVTITVPDLLGCQEVADSIDVAMVRINEAIISHLTLLAEYGENIPTPHNIDYHIKQAHDRSIIWAIIDLDITPYLGRSHKINVTLPELLIKKIDEQVSKQPNYKTRSGFIAKACLNELAKIVK